MSVVVVATGKDVERMRVDVLVQVLAHDERVPERAEIGLQIGDRLARRGVGQVRTADGRRARRRRARDRS